MLVCVFLTEWKLANVHPVFKAGDHHLLSVLSILAKVSGSVVHWQVYTYFTSTNLLHSAQSGDHSTQDVSLSLR